MFSKEKSDRPTIEQSVQKRTQRAKCNQVSENEFLVGTDKLQIIVWGPQNRCGPGGPAQCPGEIKAGRVQSSRESSSPRKMRRFPSAASRPQAHKLGT
jgi:hypothetical protein